MSCFVIIFISFGFFAHASISRMVLIYWYWFCLHRIIPMHD